MTHHLVLRSAYCLLLPDFIISASPHPGINTGASDAQRRQSYSPERSRHYQNASSPAFREGFVRGYDAGYRQYAGNNNGGYDNNGGRTGNTGVGIGEILGAILGRP